MFITEAGSHSSPIREAVPDSSISPLPGSICPAFRRFFLSLILVLLPVVAAASADYDVTPAEHRPDDGLHSVLSYEGRQASDPSLWTAVSLRDPLGEPGRATQEPSWQESVPFLRAASDGSNNSLPAAGSSGNGQNNQENTLKKEPDWRGLKRDTIYFVGYQFIGVGVLYLLPESVTNWSDEDKRKYDFQRWVDNVTHPVWDKDSWYLNFVTHPYWGSAYYTRARERGLTRLGSFLYSVTASALYEFGVEALFEPASYQDLIVTPVLGSVLGMYFETVRSKIKAKPQMAWHDHLVMVLTDPLGAANKLVDKLFGIKSDVQVRSWTPMQPVEPASGPSPKEEQEFQKTASIPNHSSGISVRIAW